MGMAGKCSPAAKLAVKSSKQKGLLDRASKIKPSLETNTQSLSDLKAGHEKSHKSKTRALELAAHKQSPSGFRSQRENESGGCEKSSRAYVKADQFWQNSKIRTPRKSQVNNQREEN